ncbi:MAG: hypothetical protein ACRC1G_09205 [Bradyrhizobium sp.]
MPLHRDIFWLGRQWAVTGFGMQAINQKHGGEFDIPIERLWDDDLPDAVCGQKWFNPEDFNKGLALARARFPQSLATPKPAKTSPQASPAIAPPPAAPRLIPVAAAPAIVPVEAATERVKSVRPAEPRKPTPPPLRMSLFGHPAKLLKVWRAQRRR